MMKKRYGKYGHMIRSARFNLDSETEKAFDQLSQVMTKDNVAPSRSEILRQSMKVARKVLLSGKAQHGIDSSYDK